MLGQVVWLSLLSLEETLKYTNIYKAALIMLHKVFLTIDFVHEILNCDHWHEIFLAMAFLLRYLFFLQRFFVTNYGVSVV